MFRPYPKPPKKEKKKRKPIPKVSAKRAQQDKVYATLRKVFLEGKICPITNQKATEVHHTYSGKDRSAHYLDVKTWMAVSRDGHNWIHDNPKEAREKGYLK
jgi:hypothetical protein